MPESVMNHIREGAGNPPIVFVHGYLCELDNWRHQVDCFKSTNTVLACDLRGLGKTPLGDGEMSIEQMGQDVADLIAAHDLSNAVLVGHSMGCRIIMEACRRATERVGGLVLVDGSRGGQNRSPDQAKFDKQIAEIGYRAFVVPNGSDTLLEEGLGNLPTASIGARPRHQWVVPVSIRRSTSRNQYDTGTGRRIGTTSETRGRQRVAFGKILSLRTHQEHPLSERFGFDDRRCLHGFRGYVRGWRNPWATGDEK